MTTPSNSTRFNISPPLSTPPTASLARPRAATDRYTCLKTRSSSPNRGRYRPGLGRISLEEALALTALVAEKEPERRSRFAVRWLRRLPKEEDSLTIEEATMAASCLSTLGGPSHDEAYGMLAAMAERATRQVAA
jgi:hypothetical protein